jgi:hypothetical protein
MSHDKFHYSLLFRVEDWMVVACLRAISHHVQIGAGAPPQIAWGGTGADEWQTSKEVTFRFTDTERRLTFLNEAARLLGGRWILLEMKDDDPASPRRTKADTD